MEVKINFFFCYNVIKDKTLKNTFFCKNIHKRVLPTQKDIFISHSNSHLLKIHVLVTLNCISILSSKLHRHFNERQF